MKLIKIMKFLTFGIFLIFLFLFLNESSERKKAVNEFETMKEEMKEDIEISEVLTKENNNIYIPPKFLTELEEKNNYVVGWITINDTEVNYPIVQNKEDNDFFLKRDIDGNKSSLGSVFLDANHDLKGDGLHTIYAHNMKNGTMFKDVSKYIDNNFLEDHKDIRIYTEEEMILLNPIFCYFGEPDGDYRNNLSADEIKGFIKEKTGKEIDAASLYVLITCSYNTGIKSDERTYLLCTKKESI